MVERIVQHPPRAVDKTVLTDGADRAVPVAPPPAATPETGEAEANDVRSPRSRRRPASEAQE